MAAPAPPRLHLLQGDITRQEVAAIVNAANTSLLGGGGVDGAIHRAGGPAILAECRRLRESPEYQNGLPTGQAVVSTGGRLPAAHVIHTVGPVWHGGHRGEPELLASCYRNSLRLAPPSSAWPAWPFRASARAFTATPKGKQPPLPCARCGSGWQRTNGLKRSLSWCSTTKAAGYTSKNLRLAHEPWAVAQSPGCALPPTPAPLRLLPARPPAA